MLNKKKVVPKLRQEVKVKVDIVTTDDIKLYYTGKFVDFTARYIIINVFYKPFVYFVKFTEETKVIGEKFYRVYIKPPFRRAGLKLFQLLTDIL